MKEITCKQTRATREQLVFDSDLNDKGTFFGGTTLSLLDENAGLAAFKFTNVKFATANYDHMNFWNPITTQDSIKIVSYVTGANNRAIEVFTKISAIDLKTQASKIAFSSFCTLVTLKQYGDVKFPTLVPESEEERYLVAGYADRLNAHKANFSNEKELLGHLTD